MGSSHKAKILIAFLPTYYVVCLQLFLKNDMKRIVYVEKH